ncbi:hypothetical protein, partial [Rhodopseudomonas palustris]|uniref:hypothetical protein n=1 Tax=Rhodopseudomonas palustris TaxID=1076 RepID=UPI001AEC4358
PPPRLVTEIAYIPSGAAPALHLAPTTGGSAVNPAYVASMVSVSPTPAFDVFRSGELRSMYVRAEA